jgi:hypothetical protein
LPIPHILSAAGLENRSLPSRSATITPQGRLSKMIRNASDR